MDWLNYHHLLYFWTVAKEGGISRAAKRLHLAQPTLSSQIKKLETSMGTKLFDRTGRTLVLTDTGQVVYRYADEIFTLGRELSDAVKGCSPDKRLRLVVGVPDVLPKLVVYEFLRPALEMEEEIHLECYEGKLQDLLGDLALHRLDCIGEFTVDAGFTCSSLQSPTGRMWRDGFWIGEIDKTILRQVSIVPQRRTNVTSDPKHNVATIFGAMV